MSAFLDGVDRSEMEDSPFQGNQCFESPEDLLSTDRSLPAIVGDFLTSDHGEALADRSKKQVASSPSRCYASLYYSNEFFRQYAPFRMLCDDELKKRCQPGIERLSDILNNGYKASGGYGTMFALHLGWCAALLNKPADILSYFEMAKDPSFNALAMYSSEIGLALWYRGDNAVAENCLRLAIEKAPESAHWPPRLQAISRLLGLSPKAQPSFQGAEYSIETNDWITLIGEASACDVNADALWEQAERIDPYSTAQFKLRKELGKA